MYRSSSKQNGKLLAFFNVYAFNMSSWRNSEVGKHSIGYRGGGTNRRQTKNRRPWVHDSTYRSLQSFALMKETSTRRFHRNLVKVSRRVVVLGKTLLVFCIGTENETGRKPCKIQISWVANPFYPSPAGLAIEGMSTRLEVRDLTNREG